MHSTISWKTPVYIEVGKGCQDLVEFTCTWNHDQKGSLQATNKKITGGTDEQLTALCSSTCTYVVDMYVHVQCTWLVHLHVHVLP